MKKMLTMFVCLLLATVAFGQWDMVKGPLTFNAPTDAATLNDTSILTVDGNVVTKTIDFGASWAEILLPDDANMRQIDAANETVAYTCGDDGLVYKTVDAGATWTQVGDTSQFVVDLKEIDVFDTNTVFISGKAGWFMKTVDGGTTWDTTIVDDQDLDGGVAFASATNGIVFADGNDGIIWVTADGGDSWTSHPMTPPFGIVSKRMYGASAAAPSTFVVTAYHNVIYLSTDGGVNWALTGDYTYAYERGIDVECFDANNFMVFTSETNVFTTADGGANWDTLSVGTGQSCRTNAFTSLTNGLIWSSYGQEYSTVDGSTFVPLHDWPGISFWGIAFPAEDKIALSAYAGGEFTMSTDNGMTFPYPTNAATKTRGSIYKIEFIDEDTGIMGGSSGLILKTIDGGDTWAVIPTPMALLSNKHINMLHIAPNGDIFAGGSSGLIMKSTNDGDTWVEVENDASKTIYDMCVFSNGQAMLTMSSGQFAISKSTALDTFELVADYGSMNFREIKERNGVILVAASDDIYKTTPDAIDTLYSVFDVPSGRDMYCLEFINDSLVYAAGQYGLVYRSYDAGETWEQVLTGANKTIQGLRYNGDKLWAVGQEGVIMSLDILETQADYSETFEGGVAELTWKENTAGANTGGLNLTVVADSAGLTNVGIYTDDAYTGLLYAETDRRL
ncbi:MAG: YCF48-related protein, partial [Candidatus Marinimicrobia bacterium]|nr:YCF48-related protein [Candidatus Neomarinimicrobiota bacterium]